MLGELVTSFSCNKFRLLHCRQDSGISAAGPARLGVWHQHVAWRSSLTSLNVQDKSTLPQVCPIYFKSEHGVVLNLNTSARIWDVLTWISSPQMLPRWTTHLWHDYAFANCAPFNNSNFQPIVCSHTPNRCKNESCFFTQSWSPLLSLQVVRGRQHNFVERACLICTSCILFCGKNGICFWQKKNTPCQKKLRWTTQHGSKRHAVCLVELKINHALLYDYSVLANTLLNTLPTPPVQVKQSIARLRLVWDERMKEKTSIRMEEKAIQERARADENQLRKKRIRQKRKEEKYIQKRMVKFATAVPEQQERA